MPQHYFIGIKIPSTFEEQIVEFKKTYKLDAAYKVIPHIEDLHVTLLYLGTIEEQHLLIMKKCLSEIAADHSSFSIYIDGLSYFGPSSSPRVVYLSVRESAELLPLQRKIEFTVAKQLDMPVSERFTPHVTIAKKRKTMDQVMIQKESFTAIEVSVHSFSLFTIHMEKSPKYEAIETFQLH
ncbi:RNA 2',3'-cyclic phosphodiesterase [Sporosarcina sp. ANT_H38]|uniref:RNA 2',3'-cyclic phosphodiesterase n=1 Tax=Sporosarcina sp. ANT_H38 TaxID=2597358 RepID=UPI00165E6765|nr:RNA 2',3'-cyclic phosphodiesterase [Sporosarcina sp. ANT_H38]